MRAAEPCGPRVSKTQALFYVMPADGSDMLRKVQVHRVLDMGPTCLMCAYKVSLVTASTVT